MVSLKRAKWWPARGGPWRIVAKVEAADEVPENLPENGAILVGSAKQPKWLVFSCPCRTGHRIMINLDPSNRPRWRIGKGRHLTIWPSIDYSTSELRCHYIIRHGHVIWVPDDRIFLEERNEKRKNAAI